MTEHEPLDPLPRELADLFESERARPAPSGATYVRILDRVSSTLVSGGPSGGDDGGSPGGDAGPPAAGGAGTSAGAGAGKLGALGSRAVGMLAAAFLVGTGAGAAIHALLATPASVAPPAASPVAQAPAPTTSAAPGETVPRMAVDDLPNVSVTPASARALPVGSASARRDDAPAKDTSLAGERALLEEARMAMAQGRAPAAIVALTRHESEFPRGRLAEEREVMLVQALARAGRTAEAQGRARAFRERYPDSLLLPIVEGAVRNPPAP